MEPQAQLRVLLDLAEELGIVVRRMPPAADSAEHPGGALVRLGRRKILFLDPQAGAADQLAAAAEALRGRAELADRYLPPEIRELLGE